jgi:hypothetical protein
MGKPKTTKNEEITLNKYVPQALVVLPHATFE